MMKSRIHIRQDMVYFQVAPLQMQEQQAVQHQQEEQYRVEQQEPVVDQEAEPAAQVEPAPELLQVQKQQVPAQHFISEQTLT